MPTTLSSGFQLLDLATGITSEELTDAVILKNGNLLLVGEQFSSTSDVYLRIFDKAGTAVNTGQIVNSTTFDLQDDAHVTQLVNGNIVVVWTDESATLPDFFGQTVRMRIFNQDGVAIGGEITVPTTFAGDQSIESVVGLSNGRFVVYFNDSNSSPAEKFRIFNADGTPATAEITTPANFFTSNDEGFVASHGVGGLIVAGIRGVSFTDRVVLQRYNANGTTNGDVIEVVGAGDYNDVKIAGITNGNYVVTWTDTSNTPPFNKGPIVYAQLVGANGSTIGTKFTVTDDIFSEHAKSEITALSNGKFVVSWRMNPDNNTIAYKNVMRVFNADGTPDSDVTIVYDNSVNYGNIRNFASLQSIVELQDGRLMYTFHALEPAATTIVATRIVDPRSALNVTLTNDADNFIGTGFNDTIHGLGGNDTLDGGGGNDSLNGGSGADSLIGGSGSDFASYFNDAAVTVSLDGSLTATGAAAGDTFSSIENISGSNTGNDTISGNANANQLIGNGGSDVLYGRDGADTLSGGAGNDTLDGGAGSDTVSFADRTLGVALNPFINTAVIGGAEFDTILNFENFTGSGGNDILQGTFGVNVISGFNGDDLIYAFDGADIIDGGAGADVIAGGADADTITGGDGGDWLYGENGNDLVSGTAKSGGAFDVMIGGLGNDTLEGSAGGFDYFYGGAGVNGATGDGNDSYIVRTGTGIKVMNDFEAGGAVDAVRLLGTGFSSFAQVQAAMSFSGVINGTVLVVDAQTQIWFLNGTQPANLTAADFLYF